MKLPRTCPKKAALAALAGMLMALTVLTGCKKPAKPAGPAPLKPAAGATTAVVTATNLPAEFVSVFDDSPPPGNKGRDPFNPDSTLRNPVSVAPKPSVAVGRVDPQLRLYSVTGSPGRWLAVINNQILAVTDPPTSVRVPGGTVMVKVVEIGEDYADVTVDGGAVKKRLTMGQRK
ncbi:MAG TPA: hypothetical protein VN765_07845 [Candidatus Acidoferrum sp.]|nr:hypothetical protein [Candidatus Acidoferrum sp.]